MHKRNVRSYVVLLAVLGMLMSLVLGACGDTATPAPAATTTSAAATTTSATTSAAATTAGSATTTGAATAGGTTTSTTTAATGGTTAGAATTGSSNSVTDFSYVKVPANLKAGPGVDVANKTITVGAIGALSGPIALAGKPLVRGQEVFFKALNDAGGIGGYKIQFQTGDSQYQTQLAVQQYTKLAPNVAIFGQVIGAPSAAALKDLTDSDHVMFLAATSGSNILSYKYGFMDAIPYPLETMNGIDYAAKQLGKKNAKFAIIYQDDEYGQDCVKGYKAIIQADGLQDVGQIPYKVTDKDFTGQVTQAKNAGADVVWLASQPAQTAGIMGSAAQLGFQPQWMLQSPAFNSQLLNTPIKSVLLNALTASYGVPWGDPNAPGEAVKIAAIAKYAPDQQPDNYFSAGWWYGVVTANILAKALQNGDISRDGILTAFDSLKDINLGTGPGEPTISYGPTPNERVPFRSSRIYKTDPSVPGGQTPITQPFISDAAKNYKFG